MKNFFANKLNIALTAILVVIIGLVAYLAISITGFSFSKSVTAIDFTGYSKTQVEQWVSDNKLKDGVYTYTYEYSNEVEKDYVVYQSVKAEEKITDALTIIYSNGADPNGEIKLPSLTAATTEEEIESWLNLNEFTNVSYLYETSETYEFGTVISISPSEAKKSDQVVVTVSLGDDIENIKTEVPDFSTYTKQQIERWGNRYGITLKIDYEYSDSVSEDSFISQSVSAGSEINGGDSLIVTLSGGKSDGTEAYIDETDYLGISESEFISKLNALGFKNLAKSNTTYFSENLKEGTIYSYEDGTLKTSKTINYALCAGAYKFDASVFNGQTKTKAESLVADYKNRNARVSNTSLSISFESGDVNADKANEVYDCTISGAKISCKVYSNGESAHVDETKYLGVKEEDFLNELKSLGFTNFTKSETTYYSTKLASGTIYSYDDGNIALSKSINYALSAGAYTFNASDFNGVSQETAKTKAEDLRKRNARLNGSLISIKFTDGSSSGTKGNTYDCATSGSTISCKVYGGSTNSNPSTTAYISEYGYLGYSEANFISALNKLGFSNLSKESTTYFSANYGSGTIYSYTPDGNVKTSETIKYALSAGKYTFNASEFNGISQSSAQSKVDGYRARSAKVNGTLISINFTNGGTGGTASNTYDCQMNGAVISCKLYTASDNPAPTPAAKVTVPSYVGQSYSSFESWASTNGITLNPSYQNSATVASGYVISQSTTGSVDKGSTVNVVVSNGDKTARIANINLVQSAIQDSTYSAAEANARDYFSAFDSNNVKITGQGVKGMNPGEVISIKINGSSEYTPGDYSTSSTTIEIVICNETLY